MAGALLVGRTLAAAVIASFGVAKLRTVWVVVDASWRPPWLSRRRAGIAVRVLCCWEIVLGACVAVGHPTGFALVAAVALTGTALTLVGRRNVQESGRCGCSSAPEPTTARVLVSRNLALFGVCAIGALAGPDAAGLSVDASWSVPALGLVPLGLVLSMCVVRLGVRAQSENRERRTPPL